MVMDSRFGDAKPQEGQGAHMEGRMQLAPLIQVPHLVLACLDDT